MMKATTELLAQVQRESEAYRHAQQEADDRQAVRDQAVIAARGAGASLGQIADALGVTRAGVQAILRKSANGPADALPPGATADDTREVQ